jgi:predicted nucleotidyltransferase
VARVTADSEAVRAVFEKYHGIRAVYLFGSQASGAAREESDVDLAVFAEPRSFRERKLDLLADLAAAGLDRVDLLFPDPDADITLAFEAVRLNRLVYRTENFDRGGTYSDIVRKFLDFEPFLSVQRKAYKRRILDGQT